jgi:hypothetical protein
MESDWDKVELGMGYLVFVVGEWKSMHEGVQMIGVQIYLKSNQEFRIQPAPLLHTHTHTPIRVTLELLKY